MMKTKTATIEIYRSHMIEVVSPQGYGKVSSYKWVQGWTMKSPNGGEYAPETLSDMRQLAEQVYPGHAIKVQA